MNVRCLPLAALALALAAAACTPAPTGAVAAAQQPGPSDAPSGIAVSGMGRVEGAPDSLTVELGVSVLREGAAEAVGDAADLADRLIAALRDQGVAEEDIRTIEYSVHPEYDYSGERERVIGYRAVNVVAVRLADPSGAGSVIDAATAVAGDDVVVRGVRFDLEENRPLLEAARREAWEDARDKAEQLADLAGVRLGRPTAIREVLSAPPPPIPFEEAAPLAAEAATRILPGQLGVTVSLEVEFAIEG